MKEMTEAQQKAKALLYEPAYASDKDAATRQAAAAFGEGYKDFLTRCKTEREVAAYAETLLPGAGGIGTYGSFVHIDVRPGPSRWKG